MVAAALTWGAVATIAESEMWHRAPVVLQVVDTVWRQPGVLRPGMMMPNSRLGGYTLVLSDGVHTYGMDLLTALRHVVKNGRVRKGSVVRLIWYCTIFGPIIFKLKVLQTKAALIGSPVPYEPGSKNEEPDAQSGGSCSSGQGTSSSSAQRV